MERVLLAFLTTLTIQAALGMDRLNIAKNCAALFGEFSRALALHDSVAANQTIDRTQVIRNRLDEILASGAQTFSTDDTRFDDLHDVVGHKETFTREELFDLKAALSALRALIEFQAEFESAHDTWTGGIQFTSKKAEPTFAADYRGNSESDWKANGAPNAFAELDGAIGRRHEIAAVQSQALPDFDEHVPAFFGTWMREHLSTAKHYGIGPSSLYQSLCNRLEKAYDHALHALPH